MHKFGLIPRNWLWNTVYSKQEVVTRLLSRPLILCQNTGLVLLCSSMLLVFIDERNQSNEIIVTSNKICKGFSGPRDFARITAFFCHRCRQLLLAIYLPQLGGATIAILLGILLGNTF